MGKKRKKRDAEGQMTFDLRGNLSAEGGEVKGRDTLGQGSQTPVKRKHEPVRREDLMGKIADLGNLARAWRRVKANKGSGGIDGETVAKFDEKAWAHLNEIRRGLLDGDFKPIAVRGVEIPKPNGGKRQLGIPTVKDRVVQQAVAQALTPRYERVFSESSHGFRPNRSAHDALRRGSAYVAEGYSTVVDLDLEKFFDKVNHDRLMARLARDIGDSRVLRLVLSFLKAGLMKDGVCQSREEGTPQGGPLSPLLANIVLDELDKELERRGHKFCRYADDCIVLVRTPRAGERVMEGITRFIERKLRLKVNKAKSKVAPSRECKFLGYTIGGKGQLRISKESKARMTDRLSYYGLASAKVWLTETEAWLQRRLRCYRLKQCKRRFAIAKFLMKSGLPVWRAWLLAMSRKGWYRMSVSPQAAEAMSNKWFAEMGLIPLVSPVGRNRVVP